MASYFGSAECSAVATLLHMNTSDCSYDASTMEVDTSNCRKSFNNKLYSEGIIPVLDMLYFTMKLDHYITEKIQKHFPNDRLYSSVRIDNLNKELDSIYACNSNPKYEWVTIKETNGKNNALNQEYIKNIVEKQFEANREYLDAHFMSFTSRDVLTIHALERLDDLYKTNYKNNFISLVQTRTPDKKRLLNPLEIKKIYLKTGLCVANRYALQQNWQRLTTQAINELYESMIKKCGFADYINKADFEKCVISAVKATSYYMQSNINYQSNSESEKF